jgi:DnaJ-class molecular chaperone
MATSGWRSARGPRQGARAHAGAGAGGAGAGGYGQDAFDLGDIFSDLFGPGFGNGRAYSRMRGRDIRFTLDIDFIDAVNGAKRRVSLAEGRTLDVAIPAGVESGQVLRLKGQGGAGVQGGPAGDALVELSVRAHPYFRREGQDIHMDLNISLTEAVEGGRVQAPTPSGPVTLTIPAGSNTGKTLRLKGKGVAGQGDQFVRLQVVLPETPDEELKKFVKKWPKRGYAPPRPDS